MPSLRTLEACFIQYVPSPEASFGYVMREAAALPEAHGLMFLCPKSFAKNNGPVGTHPQIVWFKGAPVPPKIGRNKKGDAVRWQVAGGTGLDDLSLTPSILEQSAICGWHGFVGSAGVPPGHAA